MSEVYLAEQVSLGRKVALKVLRADLVTKAGMSERFRREAQLLSSVDHPSVVRVIDFDQSAGLSCLVLELAEGETLDQLLQQGPVELPRALTLLAQLAEGLAVIHERGIVHRDLKPQNVVLTQTSRGEQARLLDFGIARLTELPASELSLSQPGQVVGTPAYLSPEQGTGTALDARSDVYSFGVLAYRVLTGVLPFPGPGARDFLLQHITAPPRQIEDAAPHLREHRELCLLVMRCLEKTPARRPFSGAALVEELFKLPSKAVSPPVGVPRSPPLPAEAGTTAPLPVLDGPVQSTLIMGLVQPTPASPTTTALRALGRWRAKVAARLAPRGRQLERAARALAVTGRERLRAMSPAWRRGWVGAAAALVAMTIAWRLLPESAAARADRLLAQGQAAQALPLIEQALLTQTRDAPDLHALRAAALHQLQRHDEEAAALRAHLHQALYSANERLIEALAEDFGRNEDDPQVREFLAGIPAGPLHKKLAALAQRPASTTQWGALRYLDLASGAGELDREALYSAALESSSCRMRISAARRLSEIGTANAIPALRKLSETPKEDWAPPEQGCGQDEAADAIRTLKKRAALGVR